MRECAFCPRILELEATLAQYEEEKREQALPEKQKEQLIEEKTQPSAELSLTKREHDIVPTKERALEQETTGKPSLPAGLPVWTILGRGAVQKWESQSGVYPRIQQKIGG